VPSPEDRGARTRDEIIGESRALVAHGGLQALTIGALERRLSYTRGAITHHFASKDAIVEAVLGSALAEIDAATETSVLAGESFEEKLEAVLRTKIEGFVNNPEATAVLLAFWGGIHADPRAAERNSLLFSRYRRQAESLIEFGKERGVVSMEIDGRAAAVLLVGVVVGVVSQELFTPGEVDVDAAVRSAAAVMASGLSPGV